MTVDASNNSNRPSGRDELKPLYAGRGLTAALYYRLKWRRGQLYDFTEQFVPPAGRVLDVGCGYGYFTNVCAVRSPQRHVRGIDLDARRIEAAKATVQGRANIEFAVERLEDLAGADYNCVILFDVIHHLPLAMHAGLFQAVHRLLQPGGILILKDIDRRPRWKFWLNYCIDTFNSRLRGFTMGAALTFREPSDIEAELRRAGFDVDRPELPGIGSCPHALYVCIKRRSNG